jgi:signal transduction histidine kinase
LDEEGKLMHIVSSFTDITERKNLEKKIITEKVFHQRQLNQATIEVQEQERMSIGKELHDNIGQQLTTIKLYLDLARSTGDVATNQKMINAASSALANVINDVRSVSRSLVPSSLRDLGLIDSLEDLGEVIQAVHPIKINFIYNNYDEDDLHENYKVAMYRIIQEQLNNIIKHAKSSKVTIHLEGTAKNIYLQIKDDGIGFEMQKMKRGLGLYNIINRAELLGGHAEIESAPGKGCIVTVSFPKTFAQGLPVFLTEE